MADWRSPGSHSPWSNYQSMGPDDDDVDETTVGATAPAETPRGQAYNPNPYAQHPLPYPHPPRFSPHTPSRPGGPDARLHIDDLRESPMISDLISLESNPRAPIAQTPVQQSQTPVQPHPQAPPLPPARPQRRSQSSTDAVGGSFLNQLVAGIWQPKRAASTVDYEPREQDDALDTTQYAEQQTPQAQLQQPQGHHPHQTQAPQGQGQGPLRLSATRTFEDMLPRRSLLVPSPTEFDIGRRTLDPEEHLRQPRATSPSMRNIHEFRPVPAPPVPSSMTTTSGGTAPRSTRVEGGRSRRPTNPTSNPTDDERSRGISTATSSSRENPNGASRATAIERAHRVFATKQVRFEDSWHADMWIYMKNAHPFIGVFGAHRWHPYKRRDRVLVLLVALLVTFLCCGVFATQKCCDVVLDTPVAVVDRRLSSSSLSPAATQQCTPFYGECDAGDGISALCTQGSTCHSVPGRSGEKQCAPTEPAAASLSCSSSPSSCPTGWTCDTASLKCAPSSSLVCYLPRSSTSPAALSFAADKDSSESGGMTAIEAIFSILIIANDNSTTTTNSTSSSSSSADSSMSGSSSSSSTPTSAPTTETKEVAQSISIVLTKPSDGGVYSVASSVPIEWEVSALSGDEQPLKAFTVEFSADDGKTFAKIASDVTATTSSSSNKTSSLFQFDWELKNNAALLCTSCVLRVCSTIGSGSKSSNVCIRSDGGEAQDDASSSNLVVTRSSSSARKRITFRIVREILECSCGLSHSSFVQFSYLVALVLPLTALLLEQLVTFYEDAKLGGIFARRGGPVTPKICFYGHHGATRVGRALVVLVLAAACVGAGLQLAQVNAANFYNQTGRIALLWLAMYALCILIGFIYSSALWLAIFSLRWKLELAQKNHVGPTNDFSVVVVVSDHDHDRQQRWSHQRGGRLQGVDERESTRDAAVLGAL